MSVTRRQSHSRPLLDCTAPMIPLTLFGIAFAVRAIVGMAFADPAYPDSFYYVNVARQLTEGNGFQVDYIWNFVDVGGVLPADPQLPIPANAHWMPLATVVQVPFISLLGPTAVASALPFWMAGAAAAPLAFLIGVDVGAGRGAALAAGLVTAAPGAVTPFLSQPDNFSLFMPLGALALWLCARGIGGDRRAFILGGLIAGLATLARNDGVLLGVPFALAAAVDLLRRPRLSRIGLGAAIACAGLFVLVVGPWLLRQIEVFGTISPSAASGRILWIADYRQLYSVSSETTFTSFLAQGAGPLLQSRIEGLAAAISIFVLWPLVAVLAPFAAVGAWRRRRDARFAPFFVYAAALFALSGLLFAVHVPHGTFIHSAVALLPHTYVLVFIGLAGVVGWIARRRRKWDVRQATMVFTAGAVGIALLAAGLRTALTVGVWQDELQLRTEVVRGLDDAPPGDLLMSPDAGAYRYLTGHGGIVTPDDPLEVIEGAARAYGVRWLILERNHTVGALAPVLLGQASPPWLSAPVLEVRAAEAAAAGVSPAAALYAVCFSPADERCDP